MGAHAGVSAGSPLAWADPAAGAGASSARSAAGSKPAVPRFWPNSAMLLVKHTVCGGHTRGGLPARPRCARTHVSRPPAETERRTGPGGRGVAPLEVSSARCVDPVTHVDPSAPTRPSPRGARTETHPPAAHLLDRLALVDEARQAGVHAGRELLAAPQQGALAVGRLHQHDHLCAGQGVMPRRGSGAPMRGAGSDAASGLEGLWPQSHSNTGRMLSWVHRGTGMVVRPPV